MAAAVVQHYFGKRPDSVTQLHGGLANYVFEVKLPGQELVVRMSNKPGRLQFFLKEQWAVRKAREHKVPVPEILEVGNELDGYPYMILEKVSGQSALEGCDRLRTLRALAGYTRTINSIPTNGFGHVFDWSTNRLSSNETWSAFLSDEYQLQARLAQFRKQKIFTPQNSRKFESAVKKLQRLQFKPALNHGDIRLKNVILDEKGEIKAIIDWENCLSGPAPHWDLSIALHDLTIDEKEAFIEGYNLSASAFDGIGLSLRTLNILNYHKPLVAAAAKKDVEQICRIRSRLNGAFDLFRF